MRPSLTNRRARTAVGLVALVVAFAAHLAINGATARHAHAAGDTSDESAARQETADDDAATSAQERATDPQALVASTDSEPLEEGARGSRSAVNAPEAQPQEATAAVAMDETEDSADAADPVAQFHNSLHGACRSLWKENFVAMAEANLPGDHPINAPGRAVVLDVAVSFSGRVAHARVEQPSGEESFDQAAVEIAIALPQLANPPPAPSDDGHVHVRWRFARAGGDCAQTEIFNKQIAGAQGIAGLMEQGREEEALARIAADPDSASVRVFAQRWLSRNRQSKASAPYVAAALARGGDREALLHLGQMAKGGSWKGFAWQALSSAGRPVCEFLRPALEAGTKNERAAAIHALMVGSEDACADALVAVAGDPSAGVQLREAAIHALGLLRAKESLPLLSELKETAPRALKAAAILAYARVRPGRGTLYSLTPLLRDKAAAVRGAAAAASIAAVGDKALSQLYLLFKESTAQPYEWVAAELAKLSSRASAEVLGRMLKRADPRVRLAAAVALANRSDKSARDVLSGARDDEDTRVRVLASSTAPLHERMAVVAQLNPNGEANSPAMIGHRVLTRRRDDAAETAAALFPRVFLKAAAKDRATLAGRWIENDHQAPLALDLQAP